MWQDLELQECLKSKGLPIIKNQAVNLGTNQIGMRQRTLKIIVVLIFLNLSASLNAQKSFFRSKNPAVISVTDSNKNTCIEFSPLHAKNTPYKTLPDNYKAKIQFPDISHFYIQSLGFICLKELRIEELTKINFRFRLGSLDYVNRMEAKPNAAPFRWF